MVISKNMKTIILTIFFLSISTSFAKSLGGATSGGGDLIGIEATKILSQVFDSIVKVDDKLYSINELDVIEKIKNQVNLIMVDSDQQIQKMQFKMEQPLVFVRMIRPLFL